MSIYFDSIDLAADRVGGRALLANDELFAPKENLLLPGRGVFIEDKYTERGKWMDGWETRRRRQPGNDWCIVRLGLPGTIRGVTVDTNHFKGNHPESCAIDACALSTEPPLDELADDALWTEIVRRQSLEPHLENQFQVDKKARYTHLRLRIFPDGGVARLRVWGQAQPDWQRLLAGSQGPLDLVAIEHGGRPLPCSDRFFSEPLNLIMPDRALNMGDGWETRRRRGPGHDWVVLELGRPGILEEILVDTHHFKGNYPESCSLDGCDASGRIGEITAADTVWTELLPRTLLSADSEHRFRQEISAQPRITHVRFNIYPDGGVSRLRLFGRPEAL